MANQITVNSGTGNITVTTSRAVIGTVANVASANYANFAGEAFDVAGANVTGTVANATFATNAGTANTANTANTATSATTAGTVTTAAQPNITSVGTLSNLTVANTITTNNLVVTGNFSVGNLVANNANFANFAGEAFDVALANVSGAGNIAGINLDGNVSNLLTGNGTFVAIPTVGSGSNISNGTSNVSIPTANANIEVYANTQHWTFADDGNLILADGNGVIQSIANSSLDPLTPNASTMKLTPDQNYTSQALVLDPTTPGHIHLRAPGSNIDQPLANIYLGGEQSSFEVGVYNGAAPNLFVHSGNNTWGFDNTGNLTLPGNTFAINYANGNAVPIDNVANANYANFAGNAYAVDGANVSGAVANATFALDAGNANIANIAYSVDGANVSGAVANATFALDAGNANIANIAYSVDAANVSGLGNIATINLDGNASNFLDGTGTFVAIPTSVANANYANFAGQAIDATQSNITQTGNLVSLTVNNGTSGSVFRYDPAGVTILSNTYVEVKQIATPVRSACLISNIANTTTYLTDIVASDGVTTALAGQIEYSVEGTIGVGNVAVPGGITMAIYGDGSDLTSGNTSLRTVFSVTPTGGQFIATNFATTGNSQVWGATSYGMSSDQASSTLIRSTRRRGNNISRLSLEPNDYLGNIEWRGARGGGSLPTGSRFAKIAPRVDSSYVANTSTQPVGIEFWVTDNSTARSQVFHANGNVTFANVVNATTFVGNIASSNVTGLGNIATINLDGNASNFLDGTGNFVAASSGANANYANFAGNAFSVDGGNVVGAVANATFALDAGNANIANIAYSVDAANVSGLGNIATINLDGNASNLLDGTGNFVAIPSVGTPNSIQNGNSIVQFSGLDGVLLISTDNIANAVEIGGRNLALYGANTGGANISKIDLINGALNWTLDNTQFSGGTPFGMTRYNTGFLDPLNYFTARGNAATPADVQVNDSIFAERMQVLYDGTTHNVFNGDLQVRSFSPSNTVATTYSITSADDQANSVFQVNFGTSNIAGDITTTGNINVNSSNVIIGANGNIDANIVSANYLYGDGSNISNISSANVLKTFGQVFSNASQNTAGANTATYVTFNNTGQANGVSIQSNSNITISTAGTYNLQFSIQATNPDNQDSTFEVWFDKNGNAIADSATQLVLQKDLQQVMTVNILANAAANDYFRIGFAATEANTYIMAVPTANTVANIVSVPSAIFTVTGV
jgi:hypothetical protein